MFYFIYVKVTSIDKLHRPLCLWYESAGGCLFHMLLGRESITVVKIPLPHKVMTVLRYSRKNDGQLHRFVNYIGGLLRN